MESFRADLDAASRRLDTFLRAGVFGTLLDQSDRWHDVGRVAFLRANDRTNHARLCRTLLAQAGQTHNPVTRFSTALMALLDRDAKDLRQPAMVAIAAASQENSDPDFAPWIGLAAGLANYRGGEHARAIEALNDAEQSTQAWCKGPALAYRALALQQLARTEEARQSLTRAQELLAEPLKERPLDWRHWAPLEMAQWSLDEAAATVPPQKP